MVQGGQRLREHGSGTAIGHSLGLYKVDKTSLLEATTYNLQLQTTELHDSKDYKESNDS